MGLQIAAGRSHGDFLKADRQGGLARRQGLVFRFVLFGQLAPLPREGDFQARLVRTRWQRFPQFLFLSLQTPIVLTSTPTRFRVASASANNSKRSASRSATRSRRVWGICLATATQSRSPGSHRKDFFSSIGRPTDFFPARPFSSGASATDRKIPKGSPSGVNTTEECSFSPSDWAPGLIGSH